MEEAYNYHYTTSPQYMQISPLSLSEIYELYIRVICAFSKYTFNFQSIC